MLSPILWQLNNPDRFDMYSVGVLLLQAAMPALRSDSALINFRRKLEQCKYDLNEWRRQQVLDLATGMQSGFSQLHSLRQALSSQVHHCKVLSVSWHMTGCCYSWLHCWSSPARNLEVHACVRQERRSSREYAEGFAMLDLDGGAPWDLLCSLMQAAPRKRLSAAAAVAHPALGGGLTGALNSALWRLGDAADKVWTLSQWLCSGGAQTIVGCLPGTSGIHLCMALCYGALICGAGQLFAPIWGWLHPRCWSRPQDASLASTGGMSCRPWVERHGCMEDCQEQSALGA